MFDKFREECGLIGVWNHPEAANLGYLGLFAQQHRGQEGAGIVTLEDNSADENAFHVHKGLSLVSDVFEDFDFGELPGRAAIGHVRYTTAGGNKLANVQPLYAEIAGGGVAIAHNGNLTNADQLRSELIKAGAIFSATSDTEVILHLMARVSERVPVLERLVGALTQIQGAYSLVLLLEDRLFAIRDPHGLRPLSLGRLGDSYVIASETCAFDLIGAEYVRDIQAGEVLELKRGVEEPTSYFPLKKAPEHACIFEYVYFARPDSDVFGRNVYSVRKRLGEQLAREHPIEADIVVPVPDSGVTAAIGYSQVSRIPLELGLIRNHYVGRTFIEPKQSIRDFGVRLKLNANDALLAGKRVIVVDDSLVRGTTSKKLVAMLRERGAREIHLRISSPPTISPCHYGVDTPSTEELIAANKTVAEIQSFIGVDSLSYLSNEGMFIAVHGETKPCDRDPQHKVGFCDACFSGDYPISIGGKFEKRQGDLFRLVVPNHRRGNGFAEKSSGKGGGKKSA